MRSFNSYGPVDSELHFCVERKTMVDECVQHLIGDLQKGGHYFTIWGARQTGKTWLMRQAMHEIPKRYGDRFEMLDFSLGVLRGMPFNPPPDQATTFMPEELALLLRRTLPGKPTIRNWDDVILAFSKEASYLDKPLIMLIDEVDTIPPALLDLLVGRFRELYLYRANNWLHGLALTGVRTVVGMESKRGSPFNVQRSMQVGNLTADEVREMYQQYQDESEQPIAPEIVENVYDATLGQPGLVSWFGELLTKTYNPGREHPIGPETWRLVWLKARVKEPNNNIMNLIEKARDEEYQPFLAALFSNTNIPFAFHKSLHNYLYMHGILDTDIIEQPNGELLEICRFSSPFIQRCLYDALSDELVRDPRTILVLDMFDEMTDVFEGPTLDLPAVLERYKGYLHRLRAAGFNPWKEQPRREKDCHLTEAVGHFHLYAWLKDAIGHRSVVSPEFPTGNGKVDVHVKYNDKRGMIEVKSFVDIYQLKRDKSQAARYAKQKGLDTVTLAVFVPVLEEDALAKLSSTETVNGIVVSTVAIGWV